MVPAAASGAAAIRLGARLAGEKRGGQLLVAPSSRPWRPLAPWSPRVAALPRPPLLSSSAEPPLPLPAVGQRSARRLLHGDGAAPAPLFLWLGNDPANTSSSAQRKQLVVPLLLPVEPPPLLPGNSGSRSGILVETARDALDQVNDHYGGPGEEEEDSSSAAASNYQFVGGMGESDPGVWFAAASGDSTGDALLHPPHAALVAESIRAVKEVRHGVPFGVYTTGLALDAEGGSGSSAFAPWQDLLGGGLVDCLHVSLHGATPQQYQRSTGLADPGEAAKAFGAVCGFVADAADRGFAVEAWVRGEFAGPGRDLALSLGAREVHVHAPRAS